MRKDRKLNEDPAIEQALDSLTGYEPAVSPQPTTEQRVTAARFDTAATERQVGGDPYKSLKIQPIEYIDANNLPYLEGNVVKYVTRHASKNGVQDIDKAIHYLELIKQMRYSEGNTPESVTAGKLIERTVAYITHQPTAHYSDYKYFNKSCNQQYVTEATYNSLRDAVLNEDNTSDN